MSAPAAAGPAVAELLDELRAAGHGDRLDAPTVGAWRRRHGLTAQDTRNAALMLLAAETVNELRRWDCLDQLAYLRGAIVAGAVPCAIAYRLRELARRLDPDHGAVA